MEKPLGLTAAQVEESRRVHGSNRLEGAAKTGFLKQFLSNFGDPIIKILLAALAINVVFLFRGADWYESAGIALAVFLATFVSTVSEYGSEAAFLKLQEEAARTVCRVRRGGAVTEVPVDQVVVGDVVLLQAGERIPADGTVIAGRLRVDQSALNGESREAPKHPAPAQGPEELSQPGALFRGTVVCAGEGEMAVQKVGNGTLYGRLAGEIREVPRESPLKERLAGLAKTLGHVGYAAAGLVALADLFHRLILENGFDPAAVLADIRQPAVLLQALLHALTLAVTVVVVAVPEGLPMMITVVLSRNMRRMLKDHVLVRKLVGIETSGSLNLLFTDKTGTLTGGRLKVASFADGTGNTYAGTAALKQVRPLWHMTALCCVQGSESTVSGRRVLGGNATDRALLQAMLPLSGETAGYTVRQRLLFDSARKYAAVELGGTGRLWLVKGAPEKLLPACTHCLNADGQPVPLNAAAVNRALNGMTSRAMRVLLLAKAEGPVTETGPLPPLTFIALVGLRDELRADAGGSVNQMREAGVQVVMVTGDNRETAVAIAREAGLLAAGEEPRAVLTSDQLAALDDDALARRLPQLRVVARALPTDKSRLVRVAQGQGLVVGMTGDGINDAPALRLADVGFAMGSGTEVAKEVSDIVVLNDAFSSLVKAVLYGRTIFHSIRKFLVFQLTMNLCAVGISVIGPFIGIETPVTVMQMLWINIIMDTLAGLAFAGEPPLAEYLREPPKKRNEPVLTRPMIRQIGGLGLFTVTLCALFLKLPAVRTWFRGGTDLRYLMTAFFALFIFTGVFNSFNARTTRLNPFANLRRNPSFALIMAAVAAIQLLLIYYGGSLFRTAGLTAGELLLTLLLALTVFPAELIRRLWDRHRNKP